MGRLVLSIIMFFSLFSVYGQTQDSRRGISIYGSTNNFLSIDLFAHENNSRISFGYSHQFDGQKNKVKKNQLESDGRTEIGRGDYIWLIDLGYGRMFFERLILIGQIGIGGKKYFTNFEDEKYTDNGYSIVTSSKATIGAGLQLGYLMKFGLEPFVGFHSLRKMDIGLRMSW